jgi:hypothetical protein
MIIKRVLWFVFSVVGIPYLVLLLHNNYWQIEYTKDDVDLAYNRSITWLENNSEDVLNQHNSILWWMLIESLSDEDEPRLRRLVNSYLEKSVQRYSHSPWHYLVYGSANQINAIDILISDLPDYNKYFIYGFTCSRALGESDPITDQHEVDYCLTHHPLSPACLTHQLMGYRFMQRSGCDGVNDLDRRVQKVSQLIEYQLFFDVRMVDVYIQRVLMLLDSGYFSKVSDRWIKRIIQGQLEDGGWGNFQPLLSLNGDNYFGFSHNGFAIKSPKSTFHATAQGVLLLTLLRKEMNLDG